MNWNIPDDIPPRRIVLRGVLAAGCSLLLPGCGKKEAGTAAAPEPAAPAGTTPGMEQAAPAAEAGAPAAAPAKVSQASVQYQTQPKGDQKCSGCLHFVPESNTCKLVEGDISPDGWCLLWVRKA